MNRKIKGVLALLLIIPALLPLLRSDFFPIHDYTHVARLVEMDQAIKDGHFPVRWVKDLGWGYGLPLFNFYAPLPYYLAQAFHLAGFSYLLSIKLVFSLTFFIAFSGMFLLAKKFWGKGAGLLAGLALVYSPYRALDGYVRGALGELMAISFLPWVLGLIVQTVDQKEKKWLGLGGLFLSLFLSSHTVLALVGLPFFGLTAFFYWFFKGRKKEAAVRLTALFLLGIGAAGYFLGPAFWERGFIQTGGLVAGYSHYRHHFLYFRQLLFGQWGYGESVAGIEDTISFKLGEAQLALAFLGIIFSFVQLIKSKKIEKKSGLVIFSSTLILFLALLTSYHSQPIWDKIRLLTFIQFPWRLNALIIVPLAFLVGAGWFYLEKGLARKWQKAGLVTLGLIMIFTNVFYFRPESYLQPEKLYYTDKNLIRERMSEVIPDYLPRWVEEKPGKAPQTEIQLIKGEGKIETVYTDTNELTARISNQKPSLVQINRFYFPGWELSINGRKQEVEINENGLITFPLKEKGEFGLRLVFKETGLRRTANFISLFSLLIIVGLVLMPERKKEQGQ